MGELASLCSFNSNESPRRAGGGNQRLPCRCTVRRSRRTSAQTVTAALTNRDSIQHIQHQIEPERSHPKANSVVRRFLWLRPGVAGQSLPAIAMESSKAWPKPVQPDSTCSRLNSAHKSPRTRVPDPIIVTNCGGDQPSTTRRVTLTSNA
jgi:hypothetical protein